MSLIKKIKNKFCDHDPRITVSIQEAEISEPGSEENRKVKLKIICVKCKKCDRLFKMLPKGIVYDPRHDPKEQDVPESAEELKIDETGKKELITALKKDGYW